MEENEKIVQFCDDLLKRCGLVISKEDGAVILEEALKIIQNKTVVGNLAMIYEIEDQYREQMERWKAGLRKRKPSRPGQPFSKIWYQAIEKR